MRNQYTSTFEQDYPCRAQIIRCKADRDAAPMNDYRYPEESGSFTGTLTFRCWHRSKPMLLCFFDADDGRKIKLSVWWQRVPSRFMRKFICRLRLSEVSRQ